jgi:hypothetical protein
MPPGASEAFWPYVIFDLTDQGRPGEKACNYVIAHRQESDGKIVVRAEYASE